MRNLSLGHLEADPVKWRIIRIGSQGAFGKFAFALLNFNKTLKIITDCEDCAKPRSDLLSIGRRQHATNHLLNRFLVTNPKHPNNSRLIVCPIWDPFYRNP